MKIKQVELPKAQYKIKCPYDMKPIGITIHETDNSASASNEIAYMQRNKNEVSFHFAVDEKEVIQGLPLNRNGWHAGDRGQGFGNRKTIAIEICKNHKVDNLNAYYKARKKAEQLVGFLLDKYNWTDKDIYTHNDHSGKNCPRIMRQEGYVDTFKKNAMLEKAKLKPVKPKPKPQAKKYITLKGRVPLYDGNSKPYATPSGKTRKVEVLKETGAWYLIRSKDFQPTDVWVKKSDVGGVSKPVAKPKPKPSNVGKTAQLRGRVKLYNKNGVAYKVPSGRNRDRKILEEYKDMFLISDSAFTPSKVWVKKNSVKVV